MRMVYDTTTVHPLDRYEHYRAGAACELAPVDVHGPAPGNLFATMNVRRIGEFDLEELIWAADTEIVTRRTERLIRIGDPGRHRLLLTVTGAIHLEQNGSRVRFCRGDIGLFDLSQPWHAAHPPAAGRIRVLMLTFPRTALPVGERALRPCFGTLMPRRMPGRHLMAQLLGDLPGAAQPADYADALAECVTGLIRRRLGLPNGVSPQTRRLVYVTRIRDVIRSHLDDPALDPDRIAKAAAVSPRYLHKLFEDTDVTPMQLVKQLRLDECRRRLEDPALHAKPVGKIAAACGYRRPDQFARDFRQAFGVAPSQVRPGHTDRRSRP
ncbi:AraC family transcriptional regulator [Dactylosporangium sp. NBC_01737]|uniref:AraC family transcriptional regulator n=1 Tax=Dactylosporangium sp. NBC_01737 TaxID=2975959 RepID=UPI002E1067DC|nr:AraC family transcriptional regulator [Dactylosporangium sp. NBC_01737]